MTKRTETARIGGVGAVVLYVVVWLLWSAIALRLDIDGAWLGVVWFGGPLVIVTVLRGWWNRQAGRTTVLSRSTFGRRT